MSYSQPEINNALGKPVAEQTQDFFIIFESILDTTPELIDKTNFKITYLVDGQGNISKPAENDSSALNVIQNYEIDNNVTVILDQATSNNSTLGGVHSLSFIGKPVPYLYSQNGIGSASYEQRLNFRDPLSPPSGAYDPVNTYKGASAFSTTPIPLPSNIQNDTGSNLREIEYLRKYAIMELTGSISTPDNLVSSFTGSTGMYGIQDLDANLVDLTFNYYLQLRNNSGNPTNLSLQVQAGSVSTDTWPLEKNVTFDIAPNGSTSTIGYVGPGTIRQTYQGKATFTREELLESAPSLNFRFLITEEKDGLGKIMPEILSVTSSIEAVAITVFNQNPQGEINFVDMKGDDSNTVNYWSGSFANESGLESSRGKWLIASEKLSEFYQDQYIETPTQTTFGFDRVTLPFNPQVGDKIRFQYNEDQVYMIYRVLSPSEGGGKLKLLLNATPPQDVLNNFVMYRVDSSLSSNIILDTRKVVDVDNPNNPFTGIILPQYPSQNIINNYDQILAKLKAEGIIKN